MAAANRRALIREKLVEAAASSGVPVIPLTSDPPTTLPAVWLKLRRKEPVEESRDVSGVPHVFRQHFEALIFSGADEKTEVAANEAIDEDLDRVAEAIENHPGWAGEETTESGFTIVFDGAVVDDEEVYVIPEDGTGTALIVGWIQYGVS